MATAAGAAPDVRALSGRFTVLPLDSVIFGAGQVAALAGARS